MIYGYARVSTVKQMKNGNSLEEQERELREAGAQKIISDSFTGTKMERPNLTDLLEELREGDKLIVTKLDRFARTAVEGYNTVKGLTDRGISVQIVNMGTIMSNDKSPINKLTLQILLAFAEFERDMIVERTQGGKAVARANGKRVDGRPRKFGRAQVEHAMTLLEGGHSYTEVEKMTGISKSTLIRARREQKAKAGE